MEITTLEIKRDLVSMGYRKLKDGVYAKPMGYGVFVVNITNMKLDFRFASRDDGRTVIWDGHDLVTGSTSEEFLQNIAYGENYMFHVFGNAGKLFNFMSNEEQFNLMTEE